MNRKNKTGSRVGNNEGSIGKRADGRWWARVTLPDRKRKAFYGRTREEVAAKLLDARKGMSDGQMPTSERMTVTQFHALWLDSIRHSVRPTTWESYEGMIRVHLLPVLGRVPLSRLQPQQLQKLYADRLETGSSPATVRHIHGTIRNMLTQAEKWGMITRNPARLVNPPRVPQRELPNLSSGEVRRFLDAARAERLEALFVTAVMTGARSSELRGLTWDAVDLDEGLMHIRVSLHQEQGEWVLTEPKTPKSRRAIALSSSVVEAFRRHRVKQNEEALSLGPAWSNPMDLVFTNQVGQPIDRHNLLRREYRPLLRVAGLPESMTFHDLRSVFASAALATQPVTFVSESLGHSTPVTTLRKYATAIPGAQRQVADAIESAFGS